MKIILVFIVCICCSAGFAGVGLVEFSCDGLVTFEGARSVKTAGIAGVTSSLVLEAGTWRVGAKAFEVVSGEVLRLGELTGKDGQPSRETKPIGKAGKLRVTAAEKEEWRLWGEDVWRKGPAEVALPPGVYRLEWRVNEAVQGRFQAVDEDQQASVAVPQMLRVLVESKTENEMIFGPKREGPPQLGDVAVLRNDQSAVVGWQRLQKPVEQVFNSAEAVLPLVTFHSPARKMAIESIMKRLGIGSPVDSSAAHSLALMAAEAEDGLGLFSLAVNYLDGVGTTKNPARAEIMFQKSVPKLLVGTEEGDAWARTALGWCYFEGLGVVKSEKMAADLFLEAAQTNLAWAQRSLGICHLDGRGTSKNAAKAANLFRKASDQGDVGALWNLARCLAAGEGVEKDSDQAVVLTRKAAESGFVVAQVALGACLLSGESVKKNAEEGVKWTREAADQGDAVAQYNLGKCYLIGEGVEQDLATAISWLRKASKQGLKEAEDLLQQLNANNDSNQTRARLEELRRMRNEQSKHRSM